MNYGKYQLLKQKFSNKKLNVPKLILLTHVYIFFSGILFINALGESIHNVCQQFPYLCRITLHKPLYMPLALVPLAVIERLSVKWEFIFSTFEDFHFASLLKNVTHHAQVCYKEIA